MILESQVSDFLPQPLLVFVERRKVGGLDRVLVVAGFGHPLAEWPVRRCLDKGEHHLSVVDAPPRILAHEFGCRRYRLCAIDDGQAANPEFFRAILLVAFGSIKSTAVTPLLR